MSVLKGRTTMTTTERRNGDRAGYPPPAVTAAVLALIAVVLGVCAAIALSETSARAFASYSPVEATVVDERTEEGLVADRRGNSLEAFRVVRVELPDGALADLRSEDLAVGTTATIYRSNSGAVYETPPGPPGPLEWALCAAIVAAAIVLAVASVRTVLGLRRSR
ncbi:MAG: hypothetical protein M3Y52_05875 [Actinomycetota bacterium]|nr:hypothetical protein [Actinomycetota bacterium]